MPTLSSKFVAAAILATAISISGGLLANAASIFDIEFPISELGNCKDRLACKAFCNEEANKDACRAFAAKYGLGASKEEANDKIEEVIADGGPGGCAQNSENPRASCEAYCDQSANMRECVAYAKKNNLMDGRELEEAEKVITALDSGVPLPSACKDARSCKAICENPKDVATMRSCFDFAEKAGLLPPGVNRDRAEKVFAAIEDGTAPFKSPRDFEQCENPKDDATFQKCLDFAVKNEFLPPEELELVKKTGGKGPGGCRGKDQCETYCQAHEEECFAFAEQNGILREEDRERVREGTREINSQLERAPEEVKTCIQNSVGAEKLAQIASGERPPSRSIGDSFHQCFESYFRNQENRGEEEEGGFDNQEFMGEGEEGRGFPFPGRGGEGQFPGQNPQGEFPGQGFGPGTNRERPGAPGDSYGKYPPRPGVSGEGNNTNYPGDPRGFTPQGGQVPQEGAYETKYQNEYQREYQAEYERQFNAEYQKQYELNKNNYGGTPGTSGQPTNQGTNFSPDSGQKYFPPPPGPGGDYQFKPTEPGAYQNYPQFSPSYEGGTPTNYQYPSPGTTQTSPSYPTGQTSYPQGEYSAPPPPPPSPPSSLIKRSSQSAAGFGAFLEFFGFGR